ncbi:AAA family ATPase [Thiohalocapsa marina]|uniref:AAA family ATPase n=1 Tax=Thiohalocapsa marina TaxID=424902 RepID=A0A5M8FTB1_9GAMM|nr:AAA family ATPase [Thiohalocapsa marina]KAA6187019.1 AAA family ATPase [Thiohalocapsa marina]
MYPRYFGLKEASFSITPDPRYLFLSEQHREALAHLLYGAGESGGFVLLTGEVGTGKTTVCRAFLEQLPDDVDVALVLNPALTALELLRAVCDEFGVQVPPSERSAKVLVDHLNRFLLQAHAEGRRPVLIIDEAQNLRPKVLEQVRLLTNLETTKHKLLQIFLIGQPELRDMLHSPDLRQLNQRITARFHLKPLTGRETAAYVDHRITIAGVERPLFSRAALRRVHRYSCGVPRLINLLCDRALLGAAVSRRMQVTPAIVTRAAREVLGPDSPARRRHGQRLALAALVLLALGAGIWLGASGWLVQGPPALTAWLGSGADAGPDSGLAASDPAKAGTTVPVADRESPPKSVLQDGAVALAEVPTDEAPDSVAGPVSGPDVGSGSGSDTGPDFGSDTGSDTGSQADDNPDAVVAAVSQVPLSAQPASVQPGEAAGIDGSASTPDQVTGREPDLASDPASNPASEPEPTPQPQTGPAPAQDMAAAATRQTSSTEPAPAPSTTSAPAAEPVALAELTDLLLPDDAVVDALLARWGISFEDLRPGLDCATVVAFGLGCERGNGRWSDLRQFDRPAALALTLADGQRGHVIVAGLDDEHVVLQHAGGDRVLPIADIDERWSGDFLLLWRLPPPGVELIGRSAGPVALAWLRERLAALPGAVIAVEPPVYDQALESAVRQFQSRQGLVVDGIAGPRTLMLLRNVLASTDEPHLSQFD